MIQDHTSFFIVVRCIPPCSHNFVFKFSYNPKCMIQGIRFPKENLMLDVILQSSNKEIQSETKLLKLLDVLCVYILLLDIYQLDKEGVAIYILIMCNLFCEYIKIDNRVLFTAKNPLVPYKFIRI